MMRWLALLVRLFSFSTWKAFFVRLFWKPPSLDVADHGVEERELSGSRCGVRLDDASPKHQGKLMKDLAKLLSKISSNEKVLMRLWVGDYGYGPLTCDEDAKVKEILGAIATSTVVKELEILRIWPMTWEGVSEALLSNQSVKRLETLVFDELMWRVLLENTCQEDVELHDMILDNDSAALVSNVLRHNQTLKRLHVGDCEMSIMSMMLVSDALRHNRTLKHLNIGECKMDEEGWQVFLDPLSIGNDTNSVLEHLGFSVYPRAEFHCDVHIGNMVRRNTSLPSLQIQVKGDVATSVVSSVGEALHFNMHLLYLFVGVEDTTMDVWKGFFTFLAADAQGQQANINLKQLSIYHSPMGNGVEEIEHDSLCDMLQRNTFLIKLKCGGLFLNKSVHVIQLLESLKSNKCLEILDLSFCSGVKGRRVLGAIMDLLDENHYLKEIILFGTPLEKGSVEAVQRVLDKKAKHRLWEVVQGMATTTPTSGRVFLCGEPYVEIVELVVPGMRKYFLHLLCEHRNGFHIVEDQEGCELSIGTESTQAFQNVVKWGLRVFTVLLKVGAHVGAGMGSMVPDLEKSSPLVLGALAIGLDEMNMVTTETLMDEIKPHMSHTKVRVAEQWLIDVLKDKCKSSHDIKRMFKLQKVRYIMEEDGEAGCVAWICNKHYEEGRQSNTLELLPCDIDG